MFDVNMGDTVLNPYAEIYNLLAYISNLSNGGSQQQIIVADPPISSDDDNFLWLDEVCSTSSMSESQVSHAQVKTRELFDGSYAETMQDNVTFTIGVHHQKTGKERIKLFNATVTVPVKGSYKMVQFTGKELKQLISKEYHGYEVKQKDSFYLEIDGCLHLLVSRQPVQNKLPNVIVYDSGTFNTIFKRNYTNKSKLPEVKFEKLL